MRCLTKPTEGKHKNYWRSKEALNDASPAQGK